MIRGAFTKFLGRNDRSDSSSTSTIILGIGNPGSEYQRTRHNVGFWCIDRLAEKYSIQSSKKHRLVDTAEGTVEGHRIVLAKPKTYVNNSGQAVTSLFTRYRTKAENLIIVYDEMALPSGKLRIRGRGSHGGHNGMRSIIGAVGTQDFVRVRIGIGRPEGRVGDINHVLSKPTGEERKAIDEGVERAIEAIVMTLTEGVDRAMNVYN
jgi:PTH1 family peptidyl-tRNA hydrolase